MLSCCFFLDQSLQPGQVAAAEDALLELIGPLLQPRLELQVLGVVVQLPVPVLDGLVGDVQPVRPQSSCGFV